MLARKLQCRGYNISSANVFVILLASYFYFFSGVSAYFTFKSNFSFSAYRERTTF